MAKLRFVDINDDLINVPPKRNLELVICIPSYNEKNLVETLKSIRKCAPIDGHIEIIILINEPADISTQVSANNLRSYMEVVHLKSEYDDISIYPIYIRDIPQKKAGVGLARKLAMDEAADRLLSVGKDRGAIVCLDADTLVQENYLEEIQKFFNEEIKYHAFSIGFEHLEDKTNDAINQAICQYESHLRYFINCQRIIELPFAYQTVGSAMAVTASAYHKLGGMNTRKAGEDFYFLHKFIKNGWVKDLNSTAVYPSPRVSDRVPFGTGKAVGDLISIDKEYQTYNPKSFKILESFLDLLPMFYTTQTIDSKLINNLDSTLIEYLAMNNFLEKLTEIKKHTSTYSSFAKRFFDWFDAFRLMKCLHYLRDHQYPNVDLNDGLKVLFEQLQLTWSDEANTNLDTLRRYDKHTNYLGVSRMTRDA